MTYLDTAALLAALTQLQERDYPDKTRLELIAEHDGLQSQLVKPGADYDWLSREIAEVDAKLRDYTLLGGQVRIRELTAAQRQDANEAATADEGADNALYRALVIQMGVKQPALSAAHVAALRNGRSGVVQRLAVAILQLSEATPEAVRLKSAEDDAPEQSP